MVEKLYPPGRNVVDFVSYQRARTPAAISARVCRHCGAEIAPDESEDDCSSAVLAVERPIRSLRRRRFIAD
jgi:hypothetical protein